jgi:hypothetical protein
LNATFRHGVMATMNGPEMLLALIGILMELAGPLQLRPHWKKPKEIMPLNLE